MVAILTVVMCAVLLGYGASVVFQWASGRSGVFNMTLASLAGVALALALLALLRLAQARLGG
jgi:hypothetical protein